MRVELRFEREIITFKCFEVNAEREGFSQGERGVEGAFEARRTSRVDLGALMGAGGAWGIEERLE
jgi:hypothetical protein